MTKKDLDEALLLISKLKEADEYRGDLRRKLKEFGIDQVEFYEGSNMGLQWAIPVEKLKEVLND